MTWRWLEGGNGCKGCFPPRKHRLDLSCKGSCCVLWSCRRSPLSPKMVFHWSHCDHHTYTPTHTHTCTRTTEPVRGGRIPGDEGEEKQEVNAQMCSRMWQLTGYEAALHVRTRYSGSQRPLGRICTSFQLTVTSSPTLNWCWRSIINFKAHSGISTVAFGTPGVCW